MVLGSKSNSRLVAALIRERRKSANLSQRDLAKMFSPPVTTQFVSNVERSITPLPLHHLKTLRKVLGIDESEILGLLEKEYAHKVSERLGKIEVLSGGRVSVAEEDADFIRSLYASYQRADEKTREIFQNLCKTVLPSSNNDN